MKVPYTLVLLGVSCACSSMSAQLPRLFEFAAYVPPASVADLAFKDVAIFDQPMSLSISRIAPVMPSLPPLKMLAWSARVLRDGDIVIPSRPARADLLSGSLLQKYRDGMPVDLPFLEKAVNMRVRGGLSWDLGNHERLVFPSFSGRGGIRWVKKF